MSPAYTFSKDLPNKDRYAIGLLVFAVLVAHSVGVSNDFTWDDKYLIPKIENVSLKDGFGGAFFDRRLGSASEEGTYYRPLRTILFLLVTSLPGPHTAYLHVVSLLVHFLVVVGLFFLATAITGDRLMALCASLLFAVHPVTTEAVASISNVKEPLATFFVLLSFIVFHGAVSRGRAGARDIVLITGTSTLALLSKETGLVIPVVLTIWAMVCGRKMKDIVARAVVPVMGVTATYLLLVLFVVPGPAAGDYLLGSFAITLFTTSATFLKYLQLIVAPWPLSVKHDIPWIYTVWDWRVMTAVALGAIVVVGTVRAAKVGSRLTFPLIFLIASVLPLTNVIPIRGDMLAERYLYMPLSAVCLVLAVFLGKRSHDKPVVAAVLILCVVFASGSFIRTREWKNDRTLFESAVRVAPDSLVARLKLYDIYVKEGDTRKAQGQLKELRRINTDLIKRYVDYAVIEEGRGNLDNARNLWREAEWAAARDPGLLDYVRSLKRRARGE